MTLVSCPGKVLITGGYLVLDKRFSGLTVAVDQRFQVDVKSNFSTILGRKILFRIRSIQFIDGHLEYEYVDGHLAQTIGLKNKFIETICLFCLRVAELSDNEFEISIQGDNDFYSQSSGEKMTAQKLRSLPKFNKLQCTIGQVKKTGLGSSAALTASLTLALLLHFKVVSSIMLDGKTILSPSDLNLVHNMSQICHSVAQSKIGSGFDISSACYGTHVYKRFSANIIDPILNSSDVSKEILNNIVRSKWDTIIEPFSLPPGFLIQLGDISSGSNTPKMVSKLLDWKSKNPVECEKSWSAISFCNSRIQNNFERLNDLYTRDSDRYNSAFEGLASISPRLWKSSQTVDSAFSLLAVDLFVTFQELRKEMKKMGNLAGIEIEPEAQTALLDGCLSIPGVVCAGVPGAGGFDAVFCIVMGEESRNQLVSQFEMMDHVTPLLASESSQGYMIH